MKKLQNKDYVTEANFPEFRHAVINAVKTSTDKEQDFTFNGHTLTLWHAQYVISFLEDWYKMYDDEGNSRKQPSPTLGAIRGVAEGVGKSKKKLKLKKGGEKDGKEVRNTKPETGDGCINQCEVRKTRQGLKTQRKNLKPRGKRSKGKNGIPRESLITR